VIAGAVLHEIGQDLVRSPAIIAWTTLGFGILLGIADRICAMTGRMEDITFGGALVFGLAQVLALVPGTSRSGITMTAGRMMGLGREAAARFSLLMSIPAILGAGTLAGLDVYQAGDVSLGLDALLAAALSCVAALAAIALMMRWLRRASFLPFVVYRVVLGIGLLVWLYA
jgi:undecaprenyl-diphosphatase